MGSAVEDQTGKHVNNKKERIDVLSQTTDKLTSELVFFLYKGYEKEFSPYIIKVSNSHGV